MYQIIICHNAGGSLLQRGGAAMAMQRLENLSDQVTEGRSTCIVKVEEEPCKRGGWILNLLNS